MVMVFLDLHTEDEMLMRFVILVSGHPPTLYCHNSYWMSSNSDIVLLRIDSARLVEHYMHRIQVARSDRAEVEIKWAQSRPPVTAVLPAQLSTATWCLVLLYGVGV
jgi:hypothetical protein